MFKGQLFVWKNSELSSSLIAHNGPILSMYTRKGITKGIITGGKDGFVMIWDDKIKLTKKIDLKEFKLYNPKIMAITEYAASE